MIKTIIFCVLLLFGGLAPVLVFVVFFILLLLRRYWYRVQLIPFQQESFLAQNILFSPVCGKVKKIQENSESTGQKKIEISCLWPLYHQGIYAPINGEVIERSGKASKFLKKVFEERSYTLKTSMGLNYKLAFKDFIPFVSSELFIRPGDRVKTFGFLGVMPFGGKVTVTLPDDFDLRIKKGDQIEGGKSVIGTLRTNWQKV